jgi:hypothetical protein
MLPRRTVNRRTPASARSLLGTTAGMQEVRPQECGRYEPRDGRGRPRRERAVEDEGLGFTAVYPHPGPLDSGSGLRPTSSIPAVVPEGEGEKQCAPFGGRISKVLSLAVLASAGSSSIDILAMPVSDVSAHSGTWPIPFPHFRRG